MDGAGCQNWLQQKILKNRRICVLVSHDIRPCIGTVVKQHFVDKIDDGTGRLVRVLLGKHVALVRGPGRRLAGHESENSLVRIFFLRVGPAAVLRVESAEGDGRGVEVFPEEKLPAVVGQGDALARHFEVDQGRWRTKRQHLKQKHWEIS